MSILEMPEVIAWQNGSEVLVRVHEDYIDLLSEALARELRCLDRSEPGAALLLAQIRAASELAFVSVLTAPETAFRLLEGSDRSELVEFLSRSLLAEKARAGEACKFNGETWTALGDMCFGPNGKIVEQYARPDEKLILDFGSPYTSNVDFGGPNNHRGEFRPPFTDTEKLLVLDRLRSACAGIRATGTQILEFVRSFNKVLICQKDPAAPSQFSSGSTGQYVGRSFLTNPQLAFVDEVELAEALVHEGIHALLYMQERRKAWIHDAETDRPVLRVFSPWSGNKLSVRSLLQAAFVWYGLAQFWARALTLGTFNRVRVKRKLSVSVSGFLAGPLLDRLQPYTPVINKDLIEAIEQMQSRIAEAFAGITEPQVVVN